MGRLLKDSAAQIKAKKIAIMTVDAPLLPEDGPAVDLFWQLNYGMGVTFCQELQKTEAQQGGKVAPDV